MGHPGSACIHLIIGSFIHSFIHGGTSLVGVQVSFPRAYLPRKRGQGSQESQKLLDTPSHGAKTFKPGCKGVGGDGDRKWGVGDIREGQRRIGT